MAQLILLLPVDFRLTEMWDYPKYGCPFKKDQSTFICITLVCKIKGAVSKGQRSLFVAHKMLETSSIDQVK